MGDTDPAKAPCVFCGRYVMQGQDHTENCPSETGLFPVREDDVYLPGPKRSGGHNNPSTDPPFGTPGGKG